jgi:hypothetical protein
MRIGAQPGEGVRVRVGAVRVRADVRVRARGRVQARGERRCETWGGLIWGGRGR